MDVGHFSLLGFGSVSNCIRILKPDPSRIRIRNTGLALILVHVLVRHAVGASRMEGSLGVSLYLSRIQQEIIAEGGTQTSPSLRYNH